MKIYLSLPAMWNFGDEPSDGNGGPPVEDAGTIYIYSDDDDELDFISRTSVSELIDDFIDSNSSQLSGRIECPDAISIARSVQASLKEAIQKLEDAIKCDT